MGDCKVVLELSEDNPRAQPASGRAEVAQIKRDMDVAQGLGVTSYLLFQEEAFPELLSWGGKHKPDADSTRHRRRTRRKWMKIGC